MDGHSQDTYTRVKLSGLPIRQDQCITSSTHTAEDWTIQVGLGIVDSLRVEIDHPHYASVLGRAYCSVVVDILNYMMFQGKLGDCTDENSP